MKFKKITLDQRAADYMQVILKEMQVDKLFKSIDFNKGHVYTYLPENAEKKSIYKFEHGGVIPEPEERAYVDEGYFVKVPDVAFKYLVQEIHDHLKESNNNLCFYRTGWWSNSSNFLNNLKKEISIYFYNNLVYYFYKNNSSKTQIRKELSMECRQAFGIMTKSNHNMKFLEKDRTDISEKEMQYFVDNIQKLFVVAYDGEGFIVCDFTDQNL